MEKIKALLLLTAVLLAATPNIATSLGQEYGYVYIKVVDADSKKPLPRIVIEIERDGFPRSSSTNSSGVASFWFSSDEFGVYTVKALDVFWQELTLNVTTIEITNPGSVFVLEAADSRFVNITVIDSLTGAAPPASALLESAEIPYVYWRTISFNGSINVVLREVSCRVYVGSPLRKAVTVDVPGAGDFEKVVLVEPTVSFNLSLTEGLGASVSVLWSDVEYFDRYLRVYKEPYDGVAPIQYVVDLTLVKEDGYSKKNVRLGTISFEGPSGEKTWVYPIEKEWLNSTAICSISIDMDWLEKLSSSPYGYHYTWDSWLLDAYNKPFMDAVFPLYAERMLQKYVEMESSFNELAANYTSLKRDYEDLQLSHASLQEAYQALESEINKLTANYTSLEEDHQQLQSNYASLQESYESLNESLKNQTYLTYVLTATTVIFIATTIYFAKKK